MVPSIVESILSTRYKLIFERLFGNRDMKWFPLKVLLVRFESVLVHQTKPLSVNLVEN